MRVLHVPGNIEILNHTIGDGVELARTGLKPPIAMNQVLDLPNWSDFDVLHLHTVEFTDHETVRSIGETALQHGKGLVFTMHELSPNIETDESEFNRKMRTVTKLADKVITLSNAGREEGSKLFEIPEHKIVVAPHGQPFKELVVATADSRANTVSAYGAMRTYRHYAHLVRAWNQLKVQDRPNLQIWIRSFSKFDKDHYKSELKYLEHVAGEDDAFSLKIGSNFLPSDELMEWLKRSSVLALPYTVITHSGQIELGLDLGLHVIAPGFSTLRSQVSQHPRGNASVLFVNPTDVLNVDLYADHVRKATTISNPMRKFMENAIKLYRRSQLSDIFTAHKRAYQESLLNKRTLS